MSSVTPVTKQPPNAKGFDNPAYSGVYNDQPPAYSGGSGGNVVTQQPGQYGRPVGGQPNTGTPGLGYLASLNRVNVHQVLHAIEVLTGWEKNNEYKICNSDEQQFLHAQESTDCCTRNWCGNIRNFDITLLDMTGVPWIQVHRDLRCQGCCCPCCLQIMDIDYPVGNRVATIKELWTCCIPKYDIVASTGEVLYKITGPCCYCKCFTEVPFKITRANGEDAGEIIKHWGGCRELIGRVNDYSILFGEAETPVNKAILIGSTFLVDFMYFERNQ